MTVSRTITRALIADEDLALGEGTETQRRNGKDLVVTQQRRIQPINSTAELADIDTTKIKKAVLFDGVTEVCRFYAFDGTSWVLMKITDSDPVGSLQQVNVALAAGQVTHTFVDPVDASVFYISGLDVDDARLVKGRDYTLDGQTITLTESYPEGTLLTYSFYETNGANFGSAAAADVASPTDLFAGTPDVLLTAEQAFLGLGLVAKSLAELEAITASAEGQQAFLSAGGRSGLFTATLTDISMQVAADPLQGVYVAFASDPTGSSGGWVRHLGAAVSVEFFGAVASLDVNSQPAFQAALDMAHTLGIRIVEAMGPEYRVNATVRTSDPLDNSAVDGHPLVVRGGNLVIRGAGIGRTVISVYDVSGARFADAWQVVNGKVFRGGGLFIVGGDAAASVVSNITLMGLTLDGTSGNTGNSSTPANVTSGDGWDITNKGLWLQNNKYHSRILCVNSEICNFRGELFYNGGSNVSRLAIVDSVLRGTNGSIVSALASVYRAEISDTSANGYEIASDHAEDLCIVDTYVGDTAFSSVAIANYSGESDYKFRISGGTLENSAREGVLVAGCGNVEITGATIRDCGSPTTSNAAIRCESSNGVNPHDVTIRNVDIIAKDKTINAAIFATHDDNFVVEGVTGVQEGAGAISAAISVINPSTSAVYRDNDISSTFKGNQDSSAAEYSPPTTSIAEVASIRPHSPGFYSVAASLRLSAPATVTLEARWYDAGGTAATHTLVSSALSAGNYVYPCLTVYARGQSETEKVRVYVTTSEAADTFVSAKITRV